jgi:DNA-binding CsgD family transcriptional regulator
MIVGRADEQAQIGRLLGQARDGRAGVLVVRGEAGIGKTVLLEDAAAAAEASGMAVVRVAGVQAEARMAYAAIATLVAPRSGALDGLSDHQASVLRGALGLGAPIDSGPLAVGAATLELVAEMASAEPLLLLVDDAHWVDQESARALSFAARRLDAEQVCLIAALREGAGGAEFADGLPGLSLGALNADDARDLVERISPIVAHGGRFMDLYDASGGNPLALVEWARDGDGTGTEEGLGSPAPALPPTLDAVYRARIGELDARARLALGLAAASQAATPATVETGLGRLGLSLADVEQAERRGLVRIEGGLLVFRHPLIAAAAYHALDDQARRRVHATLAETSDEVGARAWHLAAAATGPSEDAAALLEIAADAASRRGAPDTAGQALERAAELSPEQAGRVRRLERAAEQRGLAGRMERAIELYDTACALAGDDADAALRMRMAQARLEFPSDPVQARARAEEAVCLARTPGSRAAALSLVVLAASLDRGTRPEELLALGTAAEEAARAAHVEPSFIAVASIATARARLGDIAGASDWFDRSMSMKAADDFELIDQVDIDLHLLGRVDRALRRLEELAERQRRRGVIAELVRTEQYLGLAHLYGGRLRAAAMHAGEAIRLARACGQPEHERFALGEIDDVHALRGACELIEPRQPAQSDRYDRLRVFHVRVRAVCAFVRRDFVTAAADAPRVRQLAPAVYPLSDPPTFLLCESLVRVGRRAEARAWIDDVREPSAHWPSPLGRAGLARVDGLLASPDAFDEPFTLALDLLADGQAIHWLAHTQLCYGERLRCAGRRREARPLLRDALATFERIGSPPWAEWAREELAATGERARRRDPSTLDDLTPQELSVAAAIARGAGNREAAERLFLSEKTIEKHLSNAYRKLGVHNRTALAALLADDPTLLSVVAEG